MVHHESMTSDTSLQEQARSRTFEVPTTHGREGEYIIPQVRIHPDFMSDGRKSLSGISLHAFGLGITLGLCLMITAQMAYWQHYLWRVPFFVSILSVFHYLEFDMTARYNTPDAKVSSFLLFSNGREYNIAHTMAVLETSTRFWLKSRYGFDLSLMPYAIQSRLDRYSVPVVVGIIMILLGQGFRSLAMREAGISFNHIVQSSRKEGHVLITTGVYAICRHPAYFGFFWWGLGTQLVLGNFFCFFAYTAVLWKFFAHRIKHEEKHLVNFFGNSYVEYRRTTPVLIPFI